MCFRLKKDNDWNFCRVSDCLCLKLVYFIYMLFIFICRVKNWGLIVIDYKSNGNV